MLPGSCFISNAVGCRWSGEDGNIHTANVGNDPRGTVSLADTHGPRGARLLITGTVSYLMSYLVISNVMYTYLIIMIMIISCLMLYIVMSWS